MYLVITLTVLFVLGTLVIVKHRSVMRSEIRELRLTPLQDGGMEVEALGPRSADPAERVGTGLVVGGVAMMALLLACFWGDTTSKNGVLAHLAGLPFGFACVIAGMLELGPGSAARGFLVFRDGAVQVQRLGMADCPEYFKPESGEWARMTEVDGVLTGFPVRITVRWVGASGAAIDQPRLALDASVSAVVLKTIGARVTM